jgi:hypothetical protein
MFGLGYKLTVPCAKIENITASKVPIRLKVQTQAGRYKRVSSYLANRILSDICLYSDMSKGFLYLS